MASRYSAPKTDWANLVDRPTGTQMNDIGYNLAGLQLFSQKTGDQTLNNSVVMTAVTGMVLAVLAAEVVDFEFVTHLISPAAADIVFDVTGPTALTSITYGILSSGNVGPLTPNDAAASGGDIEMGTTGARQLVVIRGLLVNGANAGNIQLRFSQKTATVGDTIIYENSHATGKVLG